MAKNYREIAQINRLKFEDSPPNPLNIQFETQKFACTQVEYSVVYVYNQQSQKYNEFFTEGARTQKWLN